MMSCSGSSVDASTLFTTRGSKCACGAAEMTTTQSCVAFDDDVDGDMWWLVPRPIGLLLCPP